MDQSGGRARSEPGGTRWRREGKWRGNWRIEWVASTLTPPPNVVYPALLELMRTPRLPAVDWTDAPNDLNGLVRFRERRNLVSARVPSRSARAILLDFLHCSYERYVLVTGYFSILRYKGGEDTPTQLRLCIISGHTNYPSMGEEWVCIVTSWRRQSAKRGNDALNNKKIQQQITTETTGTIQ